MSYSPSALNTAADPSPAPSDGKRRRIVPLLWAGGAIAALVLVLGVSGTLSSWTSAVINNDSNTAATRAAVALRETGLDAAGAPIVCDTVTSATNVVSCTVDKYTGAIDLQPGSSVTADVTFTNSGTATASDLTLAPGTCVDTPNADGTGSLCSDGHLTISLGCQDGPTYTAGAYTDLVITAVRPSLLSAVTTLTHTAAIAPDDQITCRFTVAVDATTPVTDSGASIAQPLTWTLTQ